MFENARIKNVKKMLFTALCVPACACAQACDGFDALAETQTAAQALQAPRLTLAVSMALEESYRKELAFEAKRAGVRLVVRGLPVDDRFAREDYFGADAAVKRSHKAQIVRAAGALYASFGAVDIDPAFFRTHSIRAVPVLVLEDDSGTVVRLHGAVSLTWALERLLLELSDTKGPVASRLSSVRLAKARKTVVKAGCSITSGTLSGGTFAGVPCE